MPVSVLKAASKPKTNKSIMGKLTMEAIMRWAKSRSLHLTKFFAHHNRDAERQFFGLGQFVLLLTLAPFITNLTLYHIGKTPEVPSLYAYDANRFDSMALPSLQAKVPPPAFADYNIGAPTPKTLSKKESKKLKSCNFWHSKSETCKALRKKQSGYNASYTKAFLAYLQGFNQYLKDHKQHKTALAAYKKEVEAKYHAFQANAPKPTPPAGPSIMQYTNPSYLSLLGDGEEKNAWQKTTFPTWLLGALLIFPTVALCFWQARWGLLAFGLVVPALNYLVTIPVIFFGWNIPSELQITSTLVPQVAFLWFALRGQMRSKSFAYFILLMASISILTALMSHDETTSIMEVLLPIIVFIVAAAVARLIVKGARENAYLLTKLGWEKGIKTAAHTLLLWLPMASLAIPAFYLTEVMLPETLVNHLYQQQVLVFDYDYDDGVLDNALQSAALKTDDAIYQWHTKTQEIKKDIFDKKTKLTTADLEQGFKEKFDQIIPEKLTFDEHKSDVPLVGFIVDLSVKASQNSTNNAYEIFRGSAKQSLAETIATNEASAKTAVDNNVSKAFTFIDTKYEQGKSAIMAANQQTQASLWWSINGMRALHQLGIIMFIFVCVKSLMYVFARVSFNRDTDTFVTLGETKPTNIAHVKTAIKPTGHEYLINSDHNESYYISRRYQCLGKAPRLTIPQAFHAPIARLFNHAYTMNKIEMQKGNDPVSCSATKGMEFFEWSLAEGETVILDFHHFVGMSDSIKVSTLISPRMSSLLLGRMIFSQATGPGKLILMTKGRAEVIASEGQTGSLPPERMVAMHKNTRLHIDSELDLLNVYFSTAYIRSAGGGKIIVDVDSQRGAKSGLASFIKHFILPV